MDQKEVKVEKKFCKDCLTYSRESKMCSVTGTFTARKKTCDKWQKVT